MASHGELVLHPLPGEKRAGELVRLVEDLYRQGQRVLIWVADEGRRQILDDYLWTYERLAFVPHSAWSGSMGEVDEPVVLIGELGNPNRAAVLVVGDEIPPVEALAGFDSIHDFVPPDESGDERLARWLALGFDISAFRESSGRGSDGRGEESP